MNDVIVTGLPRSGATAALALIDSLPDAVTLNMPVWQTIQLRQIDRALPFAKWLAGDYLYQRGQLLAGKPIRDWRTSDGSALLDGTHDPRQPKDDKGDRVAVMLVRPGLTKNFTLAMKHHLLYTGLLPTLVEFGHFKIIAVIRHPLDTIASWRKLGGKPVGKTRMSTTTLWPEALAIATSDIDPLERMVQIYDLHLGRYHELRDHISIVKYEDILADPMIISTLLGHKELSPAADNLASARRTRDGSNIDALRKAFRKYGVFTKHYYPDI